MANDTSFGVGHAPLTETETIVYEAEHELNTTYHADHPELGPDVKIMGQTRGRPDRHHRRGRDGRPVRRRARRVRRRGRERARVRHRTGRVAHGPEVHVDVNTADDYDEGSVYLTVTGTSAEQGDDGSVGRGNRANGLITPNRPMSMEATSGKNPVNHIGKIYNLLSTRIAESVTEEVDGIRDLQVRLLSQIGRPIDEPHVADAQLVTEDGVALGDIEPKVLEIVDRELANVTDVTRSVIDGDVSTF